MLNKKTILGILFLILIDQITKVLLSPRDFFIGPVHLHLAKNSGLSFGMNLGAWNMVVLAVGLFIFLWVVHRDANLKRNAGFVFVLAGALSNIIDRIVWGYVRDFIDLQLMFTFNVADIFIIIGLIYLFWPGNQEPIGETIQKKD